MMTDGLLPGRWTRPSSGARLELMPLPRALRITRAVGVVITTAAAHRARAERLGAPRAMLHGGAAARTPEHQAQRQIPHVMNLRRCTNRWMEMGAT